MVNFSAGTVSDRLKRQCDVLNWRVLYVSEQFIVFDR